MSSEITTEIVDFLLETKDIPADVQQKATVHIIDGIAVMLAGSRTTCSQKVADFIREKQGCPSSTIIGGTFKTNPSDAALANGTSGHADDYDDTQLSISPDRIYGLLTHPTVPVLAAALAVGEQIQCSGKELVDAFIVGFETECKLAEAIKPDHYKKGFHTTGTIGAFGACATASKLLRFNENELRYALGITASLSSGIRVNFGTMTKPLHAGMAATNGVVACLLARRGYTADKNALDGQWGFLTILGPGADSEKILGKLGKPYTLIHPGSSIKMYPCGSLGQPSMDMLLEIIVEENIHPDDVKEIRLRAGSNILNPLRYKSPTNELQAKFSLQFGLGCILMKRRAGLREYVMEVVNSNDLQAAMKKVTTLYDSTVADMGTDKMRSIVEVELVNGRIISRLADTARGTPEKPLKSHELFNKFQECASFMVPQKKIQPLFNHIQTITDMADIQQLTSMLSR
jgi:2-methylcitrate dehydratase PrpD